ncbi:MAG: DMT family transporter [Nocardioides sp.]|uniref:DMT family transporter n=1 Tax=Nocardioides sp. TaxID=35761 RepID=UPI003F00F1CF
MNDRPGSAGSRWGLAQVCAAGVLWGTGGLVVTVLNERDGLGAMTVSAWRMLLAAVALLAFAAMTRHLAPALALFRAHPLRTVLVGCGTAAYQGLYFVSVLWVGVSIATVVSLGLAPVLAAAWEHTRAGTRPSRRQLGVLGAALVGLVMISVSAGHGTSAPVDRPVAGLVLAVVAGAVYAATTVLGHTLAQEGPPIALTTVATTVGAVALAPFLALAAVRSEPVGTTDPASLLLLAYLGLATMALAYGLLYAGLRTTSGSAATVATLVEPLSAAALAALLLGERLPAAGLLGAVLILAAVVALEPEDPPHATG